MQQQKSSALRSAVSCQYKKAGAGYYSFSQFPSKISCNHAYTVLILICKVSGLTSSQNRVIKRLKF